MKQPIRPPAIRKGDAVWICAPSWVMTPEILEPARQKLESLGYPVKYAPHVFSDAFGYAGSVAERAEDFNTLIGDDEVRMILFSGGEVSNEILPYIDYDSLAARPKILCSYSDSTSVLNAVTSMTGLTTFYGMSPRTFANLTDYNLRSFERTLVSGGVEHEKSGPWTVISPGRGEGRLTGGYLVNYAALFASPYFTPPEGKRMLFIEDHEMFSAPAVVSKWFSNLEMYGALDGAAGLIFGRYSYEVPDAVDEVLARIGEKYRIPVVRCGDFGHGEENALFPIGADCVLDTDSGLFALTESGVIPQN